MGKDEKKNLSSHVKKIVLSIFFQKNGREEDSQEALTLPLTKQAEDASFCSIPEFKNHWGCIDSKLLLA